MRSHVVQMSRHNNHTKGITPAGSKWMITCRVCQEDGQALQSESKKCAAVTEVNRTRAECT